MKGLLHYSTKLRHLGMWIMGVFAFFISSFMVGETLADPGGWRGVGMVSTWLIPMISLGALAWFKPKASIPIFTALTIGFLGLGVWRALDPAVVEFEDSAGPITAVLAFTIAFAISALGHSNPRWGGILLMVIGLSPILLVSIMNLRGFGSPAGTGGFLLIVPVSIPGALYLLSDFMHKRSGATTGSRTGSGIQAAA